MDLNAFKLSKEHMSELKGGRIKCWCAGEPNVVYYFDDAEAQTFEFQESMMEEKCEGYGWGCTNA